MGGPCLLACWSVSYTHLDVYKRQVLWAVRESPFDLEVQPPLRVRLLHGERLVLHFKLHHIACDWWSMLLLVVVRDDGVGLPDELPRSLGLEIAEALVADDLQGELQFVRRPVGAEVRIRLPRTQERD